MHFEDLPDRERVEYAGFASLAKVSLRSTSPARGKKSDITETLASMRSAPEYLKPEAAPTRREMRDVTPPASTDIVAFWDGLRTTGGLPSRDSLQASSLASRWPNLILFKCMPPGAYMPDAAFATALRAHRAHDGVGAISSGVEMTAMLSQWILSAVRDVVANGTPVRDQSRFDSPNGPVSYRVAAVPFGEQSVDHVLCNVDRA